MSRHLLRILILALVLCGAAGAQDRRVLVKRPAITPTAGPLAGKVGYRKIHVLIVAISRFARVNAPLPGVDDEALAFRSLMIGRYGALDADTRVLLNEAATREAILAELQRLLDPDVVDPDDGVIIYLNSHGMDVGRNRLRTGYLLAYNAARDCRTARGNPRSFAETCLDMKQDVWGLLRKVPARHTLVFADACFSGHLVRKNPAEDGPPAVAEDVLDKFQEEALEGIVSSRSDQESILDRRSGRSFFTGAVLKRMERRASSGGREVYLTRDLYADVRRDVRIQARDAGVKQEPQYGSYEDAGEGGEFVLIPTPPRAVPEYRPPVVRTAAPAPDPERSFPLVQQRRRTDLLLPGRPDIEFVNVPAGEFTMGSNTRDNDEKPERRVRITRAFQLGKYEVTNGQYAMFLASPEGKDHTPAGWDPRWATDPAKRDLPVGGVSWGDANALCGWAGCRLPTEAEWEYACRGPESREYPWAASKGGPSPTLAIFGVGSAARVGSCPEGASWCGAEDMAGNVWEWCQDWHGAYDPKALVDPQGPATGKYRVLRGGSFRYGAPFLRGAYRLYGLYFRYTLNGFRVAR